MAANPQHNNQDDSTFIDQQDFTSLDEAPPPQTTPIGSVHRMKWHPTHHYEDELQSRDVKSSSLTHGEQSPSITNSEAIQRDDQTLKSSKLQDNDCSPEKPKKNPHFVRSSEKRITDSSSHAQQQQHSSSGVLQRRASLYEEFKKSVYDRLHIFEK
ncbi:uncharacterized protein Ecym_1339 [Eremothecium cymbalariae DBVPG|uniref:Uncharacterized protein n=1 Tax=Eremothecium cymbalariae (strain CBS 270.75 / DBVPG 7215 / KCTC 17166 / NRRL Y-17582) TaxID=931890 RepID=G8JNA9_ERECY|nr:hypothetical protein Ecym_1339 [Eremothecium cymbalariae DBVPG\